MDWNDTEDKLVFASVIARAKGTFPTLSDGDWLAAKGQRPAFVEAVARTEGISQAEADAHIARFEDGLNYSRFAF